MKPTSDDVALLRIAEKLHKDVKQQKLIIKYSDVIITELKKEVDHNNWTIDYLNNLIHEYYKESKKITLKSSIKSFVSGVLACLIVLFVTAQVS